jgi:DNA topoisomerase I
MKKIHSLKIKRIVSNTVEINKITKKYNKLKSKKYEEKLRKTKKKFIYKSVRGEVITHKKTLDRIKKLNIPPNYENVLINNKENSKLQAIGFDDKGRKQYIYHKDFILENKLKKYEKYIILGTYVTQIKKDYITIINKIHNKKYILWEQPTSNIAIMIYLLNECLFRIGNFKYFENYDSHGIITLQKKHFEFDDKKKITFIKFIGKKGVINENTITDNKLYNIFKTLSNHKKDFIFQYTLNSKDDNNTMTINGDDVKKTLMSYHPEITPKMFRTWHTNCYFILILKNNIKMLTKLIKTKKISTKIKSTIMKNSCKEISVKLHNTSTVIKNSYLNNTLYDLFMNDLELFIKLLEKNKHSNKETTLINIEHEIRNKK